MVTGGSRGIGVAIVNRLAQDGASVAFTYAASDEKARAVADSVNADGGVALAIKADSIYPKAIEVAAEQTAASFKRIDILVNNAGILNRGGVDKLPVVNISSSFKISDFRHRAMSR